ncbi:MAG TPA: GNAT family N-acetyltransferase [Phototrophicaceae bacterium]|jgi:ribosomal protein S18 acetylase RimI-like enzyme|nr:GNAT family N-acetyltransferase [Phototrophicaceae bacterium]
MTHSHSVEVYQASIADLEALVSLFDGYRQFYQQASDLDGAREFLQARLAQQDSVIFVATLDGVAVGFTQLYPSFSSVSMKRLWVLNDLFVAEVARKHGAASSLMQRAQAYAVETGAKGLTLETAHDNLKAQRLYEGLGWQRENDFYVYYLYF